MGVPVATRTNGPDDKVLREIYDRLPRLLAKVESKPAAPNREARDAMHRVARHRAATSRDETRRAGPSRTEPGCAAPERASRAAAGGTSAENPRKTHVLKRLFVNR
jgi:hypothetical protein